MRNYDVIHFLTVKYATLGTPRRYFYTSSGFHDLLAVSHYGWQFKFDVQHSVTINKAHYIDIY